MMDKGYFDLWTWKFERWLGSVTRYIQNKQIRDLSYIG